jgi:hypothetical protein
MASILYSFKFGENYIFEVKWTDVNENAPVAMKYQWFLYYDGNISKLQFKSMNDKIRRFQDNSILDMNFHMYIMHNEIYKIEPCSADEILNNIQIEK